MTLRRQVSEARSKYRDPVFGVNLHKSEQDLREGEARLMTNMVYDGAVRMRTGVTRITTATLDATKRITGGIMFYYGGASLLKKRIVSYGTNISQIADNGTETAINTGMTDDLDTYFTPWPITDELYTVNGTDVLRKYDGTTYATITGTNVPTPINDGVVTVLDRMLAITANGIERTDPRVDSIWSSNSSWATFRPTHAGLFTAMKPFTIRGINAFLDGVIAFQASAFYLITGTNYGAVVTDATSTTDDASIQLISPNVGTRSPYSVVTVPGVGMMWYTNDRNVYLLPESQVKGGRYIGENLRSTGTTPGIESANLAQLGQVTMTYLYPYVLLSIPTGSNSYPTTQWWLDVRPLINDPNGQAVWYGPMTGSTVGRMWAETQVNDNAIYGGEGNAASGAEVYRVRTPSTFADNVAGTQTAYDGIWHTNYKTNGSPSKEKYVRGAHFDLNSFSGTATVALHDLDGEVVSSTSITTI